MEPSSAKQGIGVILLNLGGPAGPDDVAPFLYNLFSDRQIIRLGPAFLQKPIARLIAWRRAPKSREAYRQIGGGSPLGRITAEQGRALEKELSDHGPFKVVMAMRYWKPTAEAALRDLKSNNIKRLVALPLYPHYSRATSGSSLDDLKNAAAEFPGFFDIASIESWPEQQDYIDCLAENIQAGLDRFSGEEARVVYSAHSLPVSFIKAGDPYVDHIRKTIAAVEEKTGRQGELCYQSRSGPVEWLGPSTPEMIEQLAGHCRNILMVPISFVSDHVETLYEIDILYRRQAEDLGIRLERSESLNTQPKFIRSLKELVLAAAAKKGWTS